MRLEGFVNLDCRPTPATDLSHDCVHLDIFPSRSFSTVYSHAFFEHLFADQKLECLRSVHRILKEDGTVVFLGIPDFRRVAEAYLNKEPGLLSETFDLAHVHRFTNGSLTPLLPWEDQLPQVHKSLFDKETVEILLEASGFHRFCIFNYCFKQERIAVTLGFVGFKGDPPFEVKPEPLAKYLSSLTDVVNTETLTLISQKI